MNDETTTVDRPPYRVPSMAEIGAVVSNGYTVASTFSGCGGSCLGLEMSGYEILWANEFVDAARDVYARNHPGVILDGTDIRTVTAEQVLDATGLDVGDLDVLEGSPPCAAFSTAGRRSAGWGVEKSYSDTSQRVDDLFYEYVRLLEGLRPRSFVAENVSGLAKGVAKGYLLRIVDAMTACGYRVAVRLLDAQWLGVPQRRSRTIFVGVRDDLVDATGEPILPAHPRPLPYRYSIRDAIGDLVARPTRDWPENRTDWSGDLPSPAVTADGMSGYARHQVTVEYDNSGRRQARTKADPVDEPIRAITNSHGASSHFQVAVEGDGPSLDGYALAAEYDRLRPGESSDRYLNLVRDDQNGPASTVTAIGGSSPGTASLTHPTERRKFTIAELKRLCGFPDDFVLTGSYAQQWERLGRAVPPPMMAAVGRVLATDVLDRAAP